MSYTLRRMHRPTDGRLHVITSDELPSFWGDERLPSPQRQADNLILWIGDNQVTQLEAFETTPQVLCATVGIPISPTGDESGWGWLHSQLQDQGLYRLTSEGGGSRMGLRLTMLGWERYEQLKQTSNESRTAFMAMKFGDEVLDSVVVKCFRPAVERAGFRLRLLTDEQPAGLIDDQLRAAILSARFLIADLSHGNQGAYWEAGFAEGLRLPVINTCEAAKWAVSKTHFDTNHLVTVVWSADDLDQAGRQLTAIIRATLRGEARQSED